MTTASSVDVVDVFYATDGERLSPSLGPDAAARGSRCDTERL